MNTPMKGANLLHSEQLTNLCRWSGTSLDFRSMLRTDLPRSIELIVLSLIYVLGELMNRKGKQTEINHGLVDAPLISVT